MASLPEKQGKSRRDILRLAGAGVVGAAGAAALVPHSARAANGDPLSLGNNDSTTNTATLPTQLDMNPNDSSGSEYYVFDAVASNSGSSAVNGISATAVNGGTGVAGASDGGFGVIGSSNSGTGVSGTSSTGAGVTGSSDASSSSAPFASGVFGSSEFSPGVFGLNGTLYGVLAAAIEGGVDLKAGGSGRLSQYFVGTLAGGAPGYTGYTGTPTSSPGPTYELVRGENGEIWLAQYDAVEAAAAHPVGGYFWKRMNTARFDAADGSGTVFQPVRACDTRTNLGAHGPVNWGSTITLQIAPTTSAAGVPGIPSTAIGVAGNLTVVSPTYDGFLTLYPGTAPKPSTSSLNFVAGGPPTPNGFIAGLGTDGTLKVYALGPSTPTSQFTVQIVLDITAYFQ